MKFVLREVYPGIGTLTHALMRGLRKHGEVEVACGVELSARYLALFSKQHPEASTATGDVTAYPPEMLSFPHSYGERVVRVLVCGIPCTGASRAGRSKNKLAAPEEHEQVGHLFIPTLHFIGQHPQDVIVFENVPEYSTSYSAAQIRSFLTSQGYAFTERVVDPYKEFETPTQRKRWILVGTGKNVPAFNWVYEAKAFNGTLDKFLDTPSERDLEDEMTPEQVAGDKKFLDRKKAEKCGFAMRLIDGSSTKCPTICKTYGKRQPSATFVKTKNSYRMLRPLEVSRLHMHSAEFERVIAELPNTTAYEVLGQGVVSAPFESLGDAIGRHMSEDTRSAPITSTMAPLSDELGQMQLEMAM